MEQEYEITLAVNGYFRTSVRASSYEEAMEKANSECSDADFGPLQDVDWEPAHAIPHDTDGKEET